MPSRSARAKSPTPWWVGPPRAALTRTRSPRRQLLIPIRIQPFRERAGTLAGGFRRLRGTSSLPFDGGGGFGGDVVDDPIDAPHLVHDPGRDAGQKRVGESGPVGGHEVFRSHRPQGANILVGPAVPHDPDAANGQENREGLSHAIVKLLRDRKSTRLNSSH